MRRKKIAMLIAVCLMFLSGMLQAQIVVTGTVRDGQTGETLPGANVVIEGTTRGVITDIQGNFTIDVPRSNTVLLVSFIGYNQQRIPLQGLTRLEIELYPDVTALDEVVVIGYGTVDARKVAGSISTISSEQLTQVNTSSVDLALQGRAAGLQVAATSGEANTEVRIRIRGSNSISGDNQPLIVVDGFPIFVENTLSGQGQPNESALSFLNMEDVASIEVLKDASATAIYGSRGANGVLLITTKQGSAGRASVEVTVDNFYNTLPVWPAMMSGPQFAEWGNERGKWTGGPINTDTITTNWMNRISQTAYGQNVNMSVSGGTRDNRYLVSGSFRNLEGAIIGSAYKRGTLRANLNNRLSDKFSLASTLNYSHSFSDYNDAPDGSGTNVATIFAALRASPLRPAADVIEEEDPFVLDEAFPRPSNPVLNVISVHDRIDSRSLNLNLALDMNLIKNLKFTIRGGNSFSFKNRERYNGRKTSGYLYNGRAYKDNQYSTNYLFEAFGTYNINLNSHNINFVMGGSYQYNLRKSDATYVDDFLSDGLGIYGLGIGSIARTYNYIRVDREIQSAFFRGNYDFASKYILTFSGRVDGSSVFAANNKYAFFPSVGVAWRINEEAFLSNADFLDELRVRVGYGETGNQAISPYASIAQYSGGQNYLIGNTEVPGVALSVMGNNDLRWETTQQVNAGLDVKVVKSRIGLSVDYYKKTTRDLLIPFRLPASVGYSTVTINNGVLQNEGFEISLSGLAVKTANFSWNTNLNFSRNQSLVVDLGDDLDFLPGPILNVHFMSQFVSGQFVGQPFSMYYGYLHTGLTQYHDFDVLGNPLFAQIGANRGVGEIKFKDLNGDHNITADDRTFLGDPNPDFHFGLNNDFSYKNFSLNMFWMGSVGNNLLNATYARLGTGKSSYNQYEDWYLNRWTNENQHNNSRYPRFTTGDMDQAANTFIEDGSYIRLKNLSVRYDVPVSSAKFFRTVQLSLSGTNLLTFTGYSGPDPEVNFRGNRDDAIGIDFFAYPSVKTFTFGVKLGL